MKKEILVAGTGWISAGLICMAGWLAEKAIRNATGLLATGLLVMVIGALLLLLHRRLEEMMEEMKANAAKRGLSRR
jgi:hypothetical protein